MTPAAGSYRSKTVAVALIAAMAVALVLAACGGGQQQVTGLVLEVVDRNLAEIEMIRVRGDDGKDWEFITEGPVGINGAHLRQHQVLGEPVVVTYRERYDRLIALDVRDAPKP
ncbi:MAG: hypothetical protein O3A93_08445 [Chloroflexi bacterium]|nr:hypothetical protein [Chloroflexota bacterium]MDA1271273.1 hypothetical protein [Chloroflexota bacterium]PKB58225.1 MAG: hypothetical protein BZY83_08160 [SAR202 cluster bacterium Casp-Chloro-G2]